MKLPTLYGKRSNGDALQSWTIEVEGNKIRTHSGIVGGKIVTSNWVEAEAKNVGRANATTAEQQALAEAKSKWQHRFDKGYRTDPAQLGNPGFFEPMLAKRFEEFENEIQFPIYCQPKLDGIRAVCTNKGIFSRNGKPLVCLNFIYESLKPVFDKYPNLVIDGEGYADKFSNDFNKIVSLIKKTKPNNEDINEAKKHIRYHVYDCFMGGNETFSTRSNHINDILKGYEYVKLVETKKILNKEDLDTEYERYLDAGYEGQIIRLDAPYENRRTKSLLKRKEFTDKEYKIISVHEGEGNRVGTVGYMCFKTEEGKDFRSNVKGNFEYLRDLWKRRNELPGKYATIKYFNLSKDNVPRFPFVTSIRDYE